MEMADAWYQTNWVAKQLMGPFVDESSSDICSIIKCKEGSATLNGTTGICVCPQWINEDVGLLHSIDAERQTKINSRQILAASSNARRPQKSTTLQSRTSAYAGSNISRQYSFTKLQTRLLNRTLPCILCGHTFLTVSSLSSFSFQVLRVASISMPAQPSPLVALVPVHNLTLYLYRRP